MRVRQYTGRCDRSRPPRVPRRAEEAANPRHGIYVEQIAAAMATRIVTRMGWICIRAPVSLTTGCAANEWCVYSFEIASL
jgi:hypothetical protein